MANELTQTQVIKSGQVVSVNIGKPVDILHHGKKEKTGIYKYPVNDAIILEKTDVKGDHVIDRKYHGGDDKACYLYPLEHYGFWKTKYPKLNWDYGMFGENLTTKGLIETELKIGTVLKIGNATVQVSQPRQPCYKLGVRFKDSKMVKEFSILPYSGIYVRVLNEGDVKTNDQIEIIEEGSGLTLSQVFSLLMQQEDRQDWFDKALNDEFLAESAMNDLRKILSRKK